MNVQIEELSSSIEVTDGGSPLTPEMMRLIIAAVKAELAKDKRLDQNRNTDIDTRSIVDQQRPGGAR